MSTLVQLREEKADLFVRFKQLLIATVCIFAALPFHNAMPFYIVLMLIAVFFPANRCFIILCTIGSIVFSVLPIGDLFLNTVGGETKDVADFYLENAKIGASSNVFGIISQIIIYGPFYIMLAYCAWNINSKSMAFDRYEKTTLVNTFLLVLAALAYSRVSVVIQGKFYTASMLPWGLFLASFYTRDRKNSIARLFVKVSLYAFIAGLAISILSGSFADRF